MGPVCESVRTHSQKGILCLQLAIFGALYVAPTYAEPFEDALGELESFADALDMVAAERRVAPPDPARSPEELAKVAAEHRSAIDAIRKYDRDVERLRGSISLSLKADEAEGGDEYRVGTELELGKGTYPGQLRLYTSNAVKISKNELQEDVTALILNYDYYFPPLSEAPAVPWFEAYSFAERFSDNFMSIDQRYEVGFGGKLEWNLFPLKERTEDIGKAAVDLQNSRAMLDSSEVKSALGTMITAKEKAYETVGKRVAILGRASRKESAFVSAGVAVSLFAEMERTHAESIADASTTQTTPVGLKGGEGIKQEELYDQRFRWVIRPGLTVRPHSQFELSGKVYFKLPLGSPQKNEATGKRDYRVDSQWVAKLNLGESDTGLNSVALVLTVNTRFDNDPPRAVFVPEGENSPTILGEPAQESHNWYGLNLSIGI
jgi:hypothetical protein